MPSLLLTVFLLQLTLHLINSIGATALNELLWNAYNKYLPTSTSKSTQSQATLKREVVRLKRELAAVSAQDDFARWAKLRRQHDKAVAEYDKSSNSLTSTKSTFTSRLNTFRMIATNGFKIFLQFWYARQALFWIPKGWVPYYAEWILSFPRAPLGSVSLQVWTLACGSVVAMVGEAVVAAAMLAMGSSKSGAQRENVKADADKKAT